MYTEKRKCLHHYTSRKTYICTLSCQLLVKMKKMSYQGFEVEELLQKNRKRTPDKKKY